MPSSGSTVPLVNVFDMGFNVVLQLLCLPSVGCMFLHSFLVSLVFTFVDIVGVTRLAGYVFDSLFAARLVGYRGVRCARKLRGSRHLQLLFDSFRLRVHGWHFLCEFHKSYVCSDVTATTSHRCFNSASGAVLFFFALNSVDHCSLAAIVSTVWCQAGPARTRNCTCRRVRTSCVVSSAPQYNEIQAAFSSRCRTRREYFGLRRIGFLAENDYRGFGTWYTLSSFSALHFNLSLIRSTSRRSVCVSKSFKRCWDRGLRWLLPGNVVQCHSSSVVESNTDVIVEQSSSFWFSLRICGVSCSSAVTSSRRISLSGSSWAYCLLVLFSPTGLSWLLFSSIQWSRFWVYRGRVWHWMYSRCDWRSFQSMRSRRLVRHRSFGLSLVIRLCGH